MFRKIVPMYLAAATISFAFAACGGDGDDSPADCIVCDGYSGGAVVCYYGLLNSVEMCAADQNLAAIQCIEAGGTYVPKPLCALDQGETGSDPGNDPWNPGAKVTIDRETGEYVIDQVAFEELENDPSLLLQDSSRLRELDSGHFQVAATGELTDALGWQTGDVLLSVDGYGLQGFGELSVAYTELAENTEFELTVRRGRDAVVLRYRVE